MTVSPAFSVFLRRTWRWLAGLVAVVLVGFATAAALMLFWVLPNIADHRDTVASLMSRALGQRVTLEAVSGVWQQARPEFRLQGVRLHDRDGRLALELPELEAAFAWRSLLFLEPRFNRIELKGLTLDVRRARDGHFYVGSIPINPANRDSRFSNWLLRQGRVHLDDATLTWRDDVRGAPPLVLSAVDMTLTNVRRTHRVQLRALPPADLARPFAVDAKLTASRVDAPATWNGTVDARLPRLSFAGLGSWLGLPYQPQQGEGALNLQFELTRGALTRVSADMNLRRVEVVLGERLPALRLAQLQGRANWQRVAEGQRVGFEILRVALPGAVAAPPFSAGLSWNGSAHELTARALRLSGWQPILPSLPIDAALRARLAAAQPQGRIDELRFRWSGARPGLDNFRIAARVSAVGITAQDHLPGLSNVSGRIEGDAHAGVFEIDSTPLAIALPALFRTPSFDFERLHARGSWKKTARGHRLRLTEMTFANRDMAGNVKGDYEWIAGRAGIADLRARLTRAEGTAVHRYLPKAIGARTVEWAREAVVSGHSDNVQLRLQGDLAAFPFDQGDGVFRTEAVVHDAVIDYVPGWPRIEGIEARVVFEGKSMQVTSSKARIYGTALAPVSAVIPDLLHHEEQLQVDGEANGPLEDFIRFANFSPAGARLRGLADGLAGTGPAKLALNLHVPLRHSHDTRLAGRLSFLGGTLVPAGLPRLDEVRGDVQFTHDSLTASNVTAQFLGGLVRIDAATRGGEAQILAHGRATAAGIRPWLGTVGQRYLSGQAAWRGQVDLGPASPRILIESDLVGLASALPAPLSKPASQPLPMRLVREPHGDGLRHELALGRVVGAVWRSDAAGGFDRGEIHLGGGAQMPVEPGLRIVGRSAGLDFSAWTALLPDGDGEPALPLASLDVAFDAFDLMGRRYRGIRLQGGNRGGLLRTRVTGEGIDGAVTYRPADAVPARVSARFDKLTIPAHEPAAAVEGRDMKAARFPTLDVTVADFRLEQRGLGHLEATAHGSPQGLVIERLQLTHPDSVFRMSGLWRDGAPSETRAELALTVLDAGKFLARFGYADALRGGRAEIHGNASWTGSPADFAFDTLAGRLEFSAAGGQFLQINPGAGKLLGVLSLQSLPRRLNFDFRDIFNAGYAFDDINATLRIARGVVYSDDFKMRGPAAKVNMSGLADLNSESVLLRMKVIPKLSEGLAVAGALIGGPLAGVGALAAQKLLRDPIEEAISQEYMVTGPWQSPDVEKLAKARDKTESVLSEP